MNAVKKINRRILQTAIEQCETRLCFSTFVVNTASDAVNPGAGLTSLRQAVAAANANPGADSISFSATVFPASKQNVIRLQQGELQLTGDTTINGPGSSALSIDGNKSSRVFEISAAVTASLNGLTITDGSVTAAEGATAAGGGVLNGGILHLTNVVVSNNTATGGDNEGFTIAGSASGGGIYSTGSLSLVNSTVTGNTACGGAVYYGTDGNSSGGGIFSGGALSISGSTLSNNTAASGSTNETLNGSGGESEGGGIYAASSLSINSSTLSGNLANGGDGTQSSSSFSRGAPGYGGGVFAGGTSIFNSVTFTANGAVGGDSGGGGGYGSPGSGGAIFSSGSVVMTSSLLTGNVASGGVGAFDDSGAGGNASGGAIAAQASLNISSSAITSNSALGGDGQPNAGEGASAFGGGIYSGLSLVLTSSTISGNTALASQGGAGGDTYRGFGGVGQGGGVDANGIAVISNSTLAGNGVTGGAGQSGYAGSSAADGGEGDGGAIYNNAQLTITDSTLTANSAVGGPGGDSYNERGGNGADGSGSAIYSVDSATVDDSTITGNTTAGGAAGSSDGDYPAGGAGTGSAAVRIAAAEGPNTLNNTIASGNTANGLTGSIENDLLGNFDPNGNGNNLIGASNSLSNGVDGNIVGVNNPMLSPLANYGGPTQTMLPLYTSPAVNAGNSSLIPAGVATDQRGYSRIFGSKVDIGADELHAASVSGTVFNDVNGDGTRQSGEPGLGGVTVYADLSDAGVFKSGDPTSVTSSSGGYTLYGVPEGAVIIRQIVPGGYRQSYPLGAAGEHATVTPAGVTGALFADSTRLYISGAVTLNGAGQAGVLVYADLNNDGKFESNENNKTTITGGGFSFQSLTPGTYTFRVVPPAGTAIAGNSAVTVTLGSGGVDQNVSFSLVSQTKQNLTGTTIGTAGSYNNQGNTISKVFDGNLTNYFDAPVASGAWAGLDLGTAKVVTQVKYAPRVGFASRMVGGEIQASSTADFSSGVVTLFTITTAPASGVFTTQVINNTSAYRYYRYIGPTNGSCNIAELEFDS